MDRVPRKNITCLIHPSEMFVQFQATVIVQLPSLRILPAYENLSRNESNSVILNIGGKFVHNEGG